MGLLDDDSEKIKAAQENPRSSKGGKKKRSFAVLNRASKLTEKYKQQEKTAKKDDAVAPKKQLRKSPASNILPGDTSNKTTICESNIKEEDVRILQKRNNKTERLPKKDKCKPPIEIDTHLKVNNEKKVIHKQVTERITQQVTNGEQSGNKQVTNQVTNGEQSGNKQVTQRITNQITNKDQKLPKSAAIRMLGGIKLRILLLLFRDCQKNRSYTTGRFTTDYISKAVGVTIGSVKTYLIRLSKENFVVREKGRSGRGGWVQFSIPNAVYDELLNMERLGIFDFVADASENIRPLNQVTHQVTQQITKAPSKLVSNYKSTNLTKREELLDFYENVDFTLLDEEVFSSNNLTKEKILGEISKNEWIVKPFDLEEFLPKFRAYCANPKNIYNVKNVRGLFFSQLKKLFNGDFLDIQCEDPEKISRLKEMRASQLAEKAKREELKNEIIGGAFDKWWDQSDDSAKIDLSPKMMGMRGKLGEDQIRRSLKSEWTLKVWPSTDEYLELSKLLGDL